MRKRGVRRGPSRASLNPRRLFGSFSLLFLRAGCKDFSACRGMPWNLLCLGPHGALIECIIMCQGPSECPADNDDRCSSSNSDDASKSSAKDGEYEK
uniref:Putative secreted protein n=1 Tax=Anopheles triannulatus TaxID=58253 RepID=A0A2M4B6A2_9DIPT